MTDKKQLEHYIRETADYGLASISILQECLVLQDRISRADEKKQLLKRLSGILAEREDENSEGLLRLDCNASYIMDFFK
jgi:hypothetical protein